MLGRIGRTSFDGSSTSVSRGAGQRGAALGAGQGGRTATGQARAPKRLTAQSAVLTHAEIVTDAAGLDFQDGQARAPSGWRPLMEALYRLLDPSIPVDLPVLAPNQRLPPLDNRDLDKLFTALGRSKSTWRRALVLHEWLIQVGHRPDDRLCTTLIRVCASHGQTGTALGIYDWMRAPETHGGGGLRATVYTYTAAMRAALAGGLIDRALQVWDDAEANPACEADCRLCTTLIEVCARSGDTDRALRMYRSMLGAPRNSRMEPSVHAFTAAMRAASEGGRWEDALSIWDDMLRAECRPTGHAYAAVISACAAGGHWERAVRLFDEMLGQGIKPDVVSCTALITALGAEGQWERAEKVVEWMGRNDIRPNVRTFTALITALGVAKQWDRALGVLRRMKQQAPGSGSEPNAYTYSAMIKAMGDQGKWQVAERLFAELEKEQAGMLSAQTAADTAATSHAALAASALAAFASLPRPAADGSGGAAAAAAFAAVLPALPLSVWATAVPCDGDGQHDTALLDLLAPADSDVALLGSVATRAAENALSSGASTPRSSSGGSGIADGPAGAPFSYFSVLLPDHDSSSDAAGSTYQGGAWTAHNAASRGLAPLCLAPAAAASPTAAPVRPLQRGRGPLNEVVCGAMMWTYEKAGRWEEAVLMLDRAAALGIPPNAVMYNTALSALGKARQLAPACALFARMRAAGAADAVSHQTLIMAHGMAGDPAGAEAALRAMLSAGHPHCDYAYCGVISAHGMVGNWRAALAVGRRLQEAGLRHCITVHVYNSMIAACDRAGQYERGVRLSREMVAAGVAPNATTRDLLDAICAGGVRAVESQQAVVAALTAVAAAAGTAMIRAGVF